MSFGSLFGVRSGDTERDLASECSSFFGELVGPVISKNIAVTWAPGYCYGEVMVFL